MVWLYFIVRQMSQSNLEERKEDRKRKKSTHVLSAGSGSSREERRSKKVHILYISVLIFKMAIITDVVCFCYRPVFVHTKLIFLFQFQQAAETAATLVRSVATVNKNHGHIKEPFNKEAMEKVIKVILKMTDYKGKEVSF